MRILFSQAIIMGELEVTRCQSQERVARWPKTNNGDEELFWKNTACCVKRACASVARRSVLEFAFGRLGVTPAHES